MTQCIRLGCTEEAWDEDGIRSYFCLEDAWKACRGHLVLTPAQNEIFNKEGFIDDLVPADPDDRRPKKGMRSSNNVIFQDHQANFPIEWMDRWDNRHGGRQLNDIWRVRQCISCDKTVISVYKRCGECRMRLGLPENEESRPAMTHCEHWSPEVKPGHVYTRNCRKMLPVGEVVTFHGHKWCAPCRMYVTGINKEERKKAGYDF